MYSRHKQRKEQQLLNLRQLWPKSADNDPTLASQSPTTDSMANRSPNQSSLLSSSSRTASIASRAVSRTPKRDTTSTTGHESTYGSSSSAASPKSDSNTSSTIRSVNRSPTVRSQTLRSGDRTAGLQSRTTYSPTARTNASLPQSLTSHPNKQSLSQSTKTSDNHNNSVKQRLNSSNKCPKESPSQRKPLQSQASTDSTATTVASDLTISPEVLFLVKEQAKSIAKINALEKKVDLLAHIIKSQNLNDISTHEMSSASSSSTAKLVNKTLNTSKDRMAVSDDSGGEYSRLTNTSDEDELSLLLDRIVRRSQQLQSNSQQMNCNNNNRFSANASISGHSVCGHNNTQTMQTRPKWHSYAATPPSHSTPRSPTRETLEHKLFSNSYSNSRAMVSSGAQPSAPPLSATHQSPYCQPISALLFEPNVETVLKNLDDIIANEAIDSNRFSNASTLSQTYQRSQTLSQHSSPSLYEPMGVTATGVAAGPIVHQTSDTGTPSPTRDQLERAMNYVKQREEREVDHQKRLNKEWLQTQLKTQGSDPNTNQHNQLFRRSNYIDSLEPTFR